MNVVKVRICIFGVLSVFMWLASIMEERVKLHVVVEQM